MSDDPDAYFRDVLYFAEPGGGRLDIGPAARWQGWWDLASRSLPVSGDLAARALGQGLVLTTAQVRDGGVPRHVVRREVRAGRWQSPGRGVVAPLRPALDGDDPHLVRRRSHTLRCSAAALTNPHHVICAASAAIAHGLPTTDVPGHALLTVIPSRGTGRAATREAGMHRDDLAFWYGTPVTSIVRTVVDLARHDRRDAIMAGDAALRERLVTRAALEAVVHRMPHWPGIGQARDLLGLLDGRSESPPESLTRLALHDSGFPSPSLQVEIHVPGRRIPYRVDMLWPVRRLILEIDGRGKYDHAELRRERRREAELRALGYRIERVSWTDVVHDWPRTCGLLRRALAA